ncbi:hypothetical protein DMUE_6299 [Dictyocoela muelleri]|nr:hypothetical protein DMUE_6299 [Dictyocoela muelleri]
MTRPIKSEEEYNLVVDILKGTSHVYNGSKYSAIRLRRKADSFLLVEGVLFLRSLDNKHKKVLIQSKTKSIKLEVQNIHNVNHYGQNRLFEHCKTLFFAVPRIIVRDVVNEFVTCAQSQPLKTKEKMKHITASGPWERMIIDLIDLRAYKDANK